MKLKTRFMVLRSNPIGRTLYHPDWCGVDKPEYNGAKVELIDREWAQRLQEVEAWLIPTVPELWSTVKVGSKLYCFEGRYCTGAAEVLSIEE